MQLQVGGTHFVGLHPTGQANQEDEKRSQTAHQGQFERTYPHHPALFPLSSDPTIGLTLSSTTTSYFWSKAAKNFSYSACWCWRCHSTITLSRTLVKSSAGEA